MNRRSSTGIILVLVLAVVVVGVILVVLFTSRSTQTVMPTLIATLAPSATLEPAQPSPSSQIETATAAAQGTATAKAGAINNLANQQETLGAAGDNSLATGRAKLKSQQTASAAAITPTVKK